VSCGALQELRGGREVAEGDGGEIVIDAGGGAGQEGAEIGEKQIRHAGAGEQALNGTSDGFEGAGETVGEQDEAIAGLKAEFGGHDGAAGDGVEFRRPRFAAGGEQEHFGEVAGAGDLDTAAQWVCQQEAESGAAGIAPKMGTEGVFQAEDGFHRGERALGLVEEEAFGEGDGEGRRQAVIAALGEDEAEAAAREWEEVVEVAGDGAGGVAGGGETEAGDDGGHLGEQAQLGQAGCG
jgi:hypothetical protein